MIPKFRVFVDEKIREVYAVKWNEDWCFVMIDYGGGLVKTFPVDEVKLMQFTWLLDKNHKGIYEGDILESTRPAKDKYLVVWSEEDAAFYAKDLHFWSLWKIPNNQQCVVIGNIHENPELINQ